MVYKSYNDIHIDNWLFIKTSTKNCLIHSTNMPSAEEDSLFIFTSEGAMIGSYLPEAKK